MVGFTPIAANMSPMELVGLLNQVFLCFDGLVEKYDLEKIKTIGDCYMVASGVPRRRSDHATALVDLALDMHGRRRGHTVWRPPALLPHWHKFRSGGRWHHWPQEIYLRSLGRVGQSCESDESHGRARCIQITRNTYELVRDAFDCESIGLIEVKGAGAMEVWHVIGRKRRDVSDRSFDLTNQTASGEVD